MAGETASQPRQDLSAGSDPRSICPVCGSPALTVVYDFGDFSILRCERCENSWRSNMYTPDTIVEMYSSDEYTDHPYFVFEKGEVEELGKERFRNYERALRYLESSVGVGHLLDVACGSGAFLTLAKARGWELQGLDISPALARACEQNTGVKVKTSSFEDADFPEQSFDAITFWDVIEHVIDPVLWFEKTKSLLRPGGIAVFCTPNEDSLLARTGHVLYRLTGSRISSPALALHPKYHTYFFSKRSLSRSLEDHGLPVINAYSQQAFFEHSPLANRVEKFGVAALEKTASLFDARYEIVVFAARGTE